MNDCGSTVLFKSFSKDSTGLHGQATAENQFAPDGFRNDSIYQQNPENGRVSRAVLPRDLAGRWSPHVCYYHQQGEWLL